MTTLTKSTLNSTETHNPPVTSEDDDTPDYSVAIMKQRNTIEIPCLWNHGPNSLSIALSSKNNRTRFLYVLACNINQLPSMIQQMKGEIGYPSPLWVLAHKPEGFIIEIEGCKNSSIGYNLTRGHSFWKLFDCSWRCFPDLRLESRRFFNIHTPPGWGANINQGNTLTNYKTSSLT